MKCHTEMLCNELFCRWEKHLKTFPSIFKIVSKSAILVSVLLCKLVATIFFLQRRRIQFISIHLEKFPPRNGFSALYIDVGASMAISINQIRSTFPTKQKKLFWETPTSKQQQTGNGIRKVTDLQSLLPLDYAVHCTAPI